MTEGLIQFFKLEKNEALFKKALRPKSVGGSDEFKRMAREGDILLNKALMEIFKGNYSTGILNEQMSSIHNRYSLIRLGYHLKIDKYMSDYYASNDFSDNDIGEAIEALLYAAAKVNKKNTKQIVKKMVVIIQKNSYFEVNYIGDLMKHYDANSFTRPEFIRIDAGGPDHKKQWRCKIIDDYFGTKKEYTSDVFPTFQEAKQDAAYIFLSELNGISKPTHRKPRPKSASEITVERKITQSLDIPEIQLTKLEINNTMQLSKNTGEKLLDWVERKKSKNQHSMLISLSARLEEISIAVWDATFEFAEMSLLNIKINDKHFFEIGTGPSRTKARKDAAEKILKSSKLINWLTENKKDEMI